MRILKTNFILLVTCLLLQNCASQKPAVTQIKDVWTKEKANEWYSKQDWLVGANFMPSNAINQLEMWQESTFDTITIDRELGWAESLGMNTTRVFLHDLLHQQDSIGLYSRMNIFLRIADRHHIKPMFVLFDSCWDPFPKLGLQRDPKPFVHNSGWVQSPGYHALKDTMQFLRLERYVKGVVSKFANDERIISWDVWNEPDNTTGPSYEKVDLPNKVSYVYPLLKKAFAWTRLANPSQPITSGIWVGDWTKAEKIKPIETLQIEQSDIISFHNYDDAQEFEKRIKLLQRYGKPLLCTEYMARPNGSTFKGFLPIAKKHKVAMYNWGFVEGKSQTIFPWDSWTKQYSSEPTVWFHDIFRTNGTPYKQEEVELIKELNSSK